MDDDQLLETYIKYCMDFHDNSSECSFVYDLNLHLVYCTKLYLSLWKQNKQDEIKNSLNQNVVYKLFTDATHRDVIAGLYKDAVHGKKTSYVLTANLDRIDEYIYMMAQISPIINPKTGNVIGVNVLFYKDLPILWQELKYELARKSEIGIAGKVNLKEHKNEILFLLCHFDTYAQIIEVLTGNFECHLTESTVRKYIQRHLYEEYGVINKNDLRIKLIKLQMYKYPPRSLCKSLFIKIA